MIKHKCQFASQASKNIGAKNFKKMQLNTNAILELVAEKPLVMPRLGKIK